jgi:hypothetical protein
VRPTDGDGSVVEELGDLKFFIRQLQNDLNLTDDEIEEHNRAKLSKRYEKLAYSDTEAHARADKEPRCEESFIREQLGQ